MDSPSHGTRKRLVIAVTIIAGALILEVVGALISGSLALLADAGHVFSDLIGLIVALVATIVASRPASDRHTFGYRRVEVFAALANGLILTGVAVFVFVEAIGRLVHPDAAGIDSRVMIVIGSIGAAANFATMLVLRSGAGESLNLRGAYLEALGDLVGSVAVVIAGVVIAFTGFAAADAIASLAIAVFIVPRALGLLRDVFRVLSESVPRGTDVELIRQHILELDGVIDVHDVHVWAITSGSHVFTAHVIVEPGVFSGARAGILLDQLGDCLTEHFDVGHSTFQLEPSSHAGHESQPHR